MPRLSELKSGQTARILNFLDPEIGARLMDMGCVPGESLKISKYAPLGCPLAIEIAGVELSLRTKEADSVEVDLEQI